MIVQRYGPAILALALALWLALPPARAMAQTPASDQPAVTYRRVFQGSLPEFIEITVRQDGAAQADVRQLDDAASPQEFTVGPAIRGVIFNLTRDLKNFQNAKLESPRRVAFLGKKTLRWEKGAEAHEVEFNYTVDPKASQLQRMFDNLAQEQTDLQMLEQRARFDRLGVSDALTRFEDHLNQRIVPDPERFLPVLDRIVEDSRQLEIARQQARSLAARIRVAQAR